jgi:hypothetical protein
MSLIKLQLRARKCETSGVSKMPDGKVPCLLVDLTDVPAGDVLEQISTEDIVDYLRENTDVAVSYRHSPIA